MNHHITKYKNEKNETVVTSWFQINVLNRCFCFFKKELIVK
ncbi:hypothetical protein [Listeria marthii]|nr:hypothetical protein [Listeria marthii]